MSGFRWSNEEEHLLWLLIPTNTFQEIAEEFLRRSDSALPGFKETRSADAIRRKCERDNINPESSTTYEDPYTRRWADLKRIADLYRLERETCSTGLVAKENIVRKILAISDIHFPFTRVELLDQVLEQHADADIVVVNGDIVDGYIFSTFAKSRVVPACHEYIMAFNLIQTLSENFPKVVLTSGNHDVRAAKALGRAGFDRNATQILGPDFIARIANGEEIDQFGTLKEKHEFNNVIYQRPETWWVQIGKTIFVHPHGWGKSGPGGTVYKLDEIFSNRFGTSAYDSIVCGHCFDEETEILTNNGWKSIDTISYEDQAATLNLTSDLIEWNQIEDIPKYDNHKELIYFGGKSGIEVAVTPEHGMLYSTYYKRDKGIGWEKAQAQEIESRSQFLIPTSGKETKTPDFPISDAHLQLLGWIVSEGSLDRNKNGQKLSIRIAQSDDSNHYVQEIEQLLLAANIPYTCRQRYSANTTEHGQHRNYDAYRFGIGVEYSSWVLDYLKIDKTFVQSFISSLSYKQRRLLLEALCKGDGSKCGTDRWAAYYTNNSVLRDQIQFLAAITGFNTSYGGPREDGTYWINLNETKNTRSINQIERRAYNGRTFCLTVKNGTLIARRKGHVFLTQNTHKISKLVCNNRMLIEQGSFSARQDYEHKADMKFHHAMNGYCVIYQDMSGNTDFNSSGPVYLGSELSPKKTVL